MTEATLCDAIGGQDEECLIGRTGRAGEKGTLWTLLEEHDLANARALCESLKDANQPLPPFVENACRDWRRYVELQKTWVADQRAAKARQVAEEGKVQREASSSRAERERETMQAMREQIAERQAQDPMASSSICPYHMQNEHLYMSETIDYDKPFFEVRDAPEGRFHWCTLCRKWVDEGHVLRCAQLAFEASWRPDSSSEASWKRIHTYRHRLSFEIVRLGSLAWVCCL
jgi:superfamily II DNA/RNA helicase